MKSIWDSCNAANVQVPEEVFDFFEYGEPTDEGQIVDIGDAKSVYNDDCSSGFDIDLSKLDPKITKVRFYNSW